MNEKLYKKVDNLYQVYSICTLIKIREERPNFTVFPGVKNVIEIY